MISPSGKNAKQCSYQSSPMVQARVPRHIYMIYKYKSKNQYQRNFIFCSCVAKIYYWNFKNQSQEIIDFILHSPIRNKLAHFCRYKIKTDSYELLNDFAMLVNLKTYETLISVLPASRRFMAFLFVCLP